MTFFVQFSILCAYAFVICLSTGVASDVGSTMEEQNATEWLKMYNTMASEIYYKDSIAAWNWNTNITDYNQNISVSTKNLKM